MSATSAGQFAGHKPLLIDDLCTAFIGPPDRGRNCKTGAHERIVVAVRRLIAFPASGRFGKIAGHTGS
jgi:hypothetical protein